MTYVVFQRNAVSIVTSRGQHGTRVMGVTALVHGMGLTVVKRPSLVPLIIKPMVVVVVV